MMISEYLQRDFVLAKARFQRDLLVDLALRYRAHDPRAIQQLGERGLSVEEVDGLAAAITEALAHAEADQHPPGTGAYIPSNSVLCALQAGWTQEAANRGIAQKKTPAPLPPVESTAATDEPDGYSPQVTPAAVGVSPAAPVVEDASPQFRIGSAPALASTTDAATEETDTFSPPLQPEAVSAGDYVENSDVFYGLDGILAKMKRLFRKARDFNPFAARTASSAKPLRLYLFGDWGTGLPLAHKVTAQIASQIGGGGSAVQQHVVHLGDVYYVGNPDEYEHNMLHGSLWPVTVGQQKSVGSWSLNGNHDMYSGGWGYFDTLLKDSRFSRWQADAQGDPSSFFLIEDDHWQIFGLDTSWMLPDFSQTLLGEYTWKDYGGQNGALEHGQVEWMQANRDPKKGCVLLTHHQPASSRHNEDQHSDEAVTRLKTAGLYDQLDAWIWGHEHRGVVFKPKDQRVDPKLRDAPEFCACLGHGGVPVPEENFDLGNRKPDVEWEEDRLDATSPLYEGQRIVPYGFATMDTSAEAIEFKMFDHNGVQRGVWTIQRYFQSP